MGGHIAELLFIGDKNISAGCGSDLQNATGMAYAAVRRYGMFGESAGYISSDKKDTSEEYNAKIDAEVKKILKVRPNH
jgi:ATP-dependent metalloprotease